MSLPRRRRLGPSRRVLLSCWLGLTGSGPCHSGCQSRYRQNSLLSPAPERLRRSLLPDIRRAGDSGARDSLAPRSTSKWRPDVRLCKALPHRSSAKFQPHRSCFVGSRPLGCLRLLHHCILVINDRTHNLLRSFLYSD